MALLYKTVCVLVSGPIGSGKTTFSNMLVASLNERGLNTERFALADSIRRLATHMGWDGAKDAKGRRLLQTLGTDCGREYNENCWVSMLIDKIIPNMSRYPFDFIVIDDWRFPNERDYIEKNILYDVYPIRIIERSSEDPNNGHTSEHSLPENNEGDYYQSMIYNGNDIYTLQRIADDMAVELIKKYNKGVN